MGPRKLRTAPMTGLKAEDGARCRAEPELWFAPAREQYAIALCQACPALDACRRLVARLDTDRGVQLGVWAGLPAQQRTYDSSADCKRCGRPMRPHRGFAEDYPGTVSRGNAYMCRPCRQRS